MRRFLLGLALATIATAGVAQTRVNGHFRSNGTYVAPHYRTAPNSSTYDNYSTRPNYNPYTGQTGTRSATPSYGTSRRPPCYYNCGR